MKDIRERSILDCGRAPPARTLIRRFRRGLVCSALGALGACGGYQPTTTTTDVAGALQLESAAYYAFLQPVSASASFGGTRGPAIALEPGPFRCASYLADAHDGVDALEGAEGCPADLARRLRVHENAGRMLLVVGDDGSESRYVRGSELGPIDTAQEALAAVWLDGRYSLSFKNGDAYVGSLAAGQVRRVEGGFEVTGGAEAEVGDCESMSKRLFRVTLLVRPDASIEERDRTQVDEYELGDPCMPLGRRPEGFVDTAPGRTLPRILARAAHHEAESVRAFRRLARELESFGAPDLAEASRRAAVDEVRHVRMWVALAERLGFPVAPLIDTDQLPLRDLEAVALDNAVEGCVYEAYAAVSALHQARHAETEELRAHFAAIADDELDHAALARACVETLNPHLDDAALERQRAATRGAEAELAATLRDPNESERFLGFPAPIIARGLLDAIAR